MGHAVDNKEQIYLALADRLNKNPVGAPVNETLMDILKRLYTLGEAELGSRFPMLPVTLDQISKTSGQDKGELEVILSSMADKGLVIDIPRRDKTYYMLAPMVVGFFEYTFMRAERAGLRDLAVLFEKYMQDREVQEEMFGGQTKMFRALAYEHLLPLAVETEVLSYEKASEIIRRSGGGALSTCACRHKAAHLGKACSAPARDICTSLGNAGQWLVRRGFAREATVEQLLGNLQRAQEAGLVLLCDNVLSKPTFICCCCGCCCGVLRAINENNIPSVQPGNFIPAPDTDKCIGCSVCVDSCHIRAMEMVETGDGRELPSILEKRCIGCGVCAASCPGEALIMVQREEVYVPPRSKREQFLSIAREKNRRG